MKKSQKLIETKKRMKEKMKRAVSYVIMVALLVTSINVTAFAANTSYVNVGFNVFNLNDYSANAELATGIYEVYEDLTFTGTDATSSGDGTNGLRIKSGATVYIIFKLDVTLTVSGGAGYAKSPGKAGILVPSNATLIFMGTGTVKATGGKAGNGSAGGTGGTSYANNSNSGCYAAAGGTGGNGGGGAGAGIGTDGGTGGNGAGAGATSLSINLDNWYTGNRGSRGASGAAASQMGSIYKPDSVTINATGGTGGTGGATGTCGNWSNQHYYSLNYRAIAGGAGGGGGGGGLAGAGIGTGGGGGGQGGGGAGAGYTWAGYSVGAGGGGGGYGATNGTGGICSVTTELSMSTSDTRTLVQYANNGSNGGAGGNGASAYMRNNSGTIYQGVGGTGGDGGSKGAAATSKTVQALTDNLIPAFKITYNSNDSNASTTETIVAYDETHTVADNTFVREGYTYKNWNTQADGSGTSYVAGEEIVFNCSTQLYAIWEADSYTITLSSGNDATYAGTKTIYEKYDTGYYLNETMSSSKLMTANTNKIQIPKKNGYNFKGYFTSGDTQIIDANGYITGTYTTETEISAKWEAKHAYYTIEYHANGGTKKAGADTLQSRTYTVADDTFTLNPMSGMFEAPVSSNGSACEFLGWATSPSSSEAEYADNASVSDFTDVNGATIHLYAVWRSTLPTSIQNGSFEAPAIGSWYSIMPDTTNSIAWKTTASDHKIEFGRPSKNMSAANSAYHTTTVVDGYQFAELCANQVGALYQTVSTFSGNTLKWGFSHRGRSGEDTMELWIGAPADVTAVLDYYKSHNNSVAGISGDLLDTYKIISANGTRSYTDGNTQWNSYTGDYVVPDGQIETTFAFVSISASGNKISFGNLLDNVYFTAEVPPKTQLFEYDATNGGVAVAEVNGIATSGKEAFVRVGSTIEIYPAANEGYTYNGGFVNGSYKSVDELPLRYTVSDADTSLKHITLLFSKDSTIIFDKEGGSYEDDEYDLKASGNNQYYTLKSNPTKEGYAFNNWLIVGSDVTLTEGNYIAYETDEDSKTYIRVYDNSSRTNKLYECESEFGINLIATYQFTAFPSAKIELSMDGGNVAGVNSLSYELNTFDLSDSATQSDRIEYTAMTLPTPTKDGYIFAGWKIGDKVYDAGTEIKYEISITNENGKVTIGTDAQSAITSDTTYTLLAQWITLPMTEVTASGVTKVYDGSPSDVITVSGIPAGATVTYGTVEGTYDLSACPTYTYAGDYTVYYKVSAYEYTDYTGSAVIKIHPKPVSITWSTEDEFTYDGSEHSVTATVNNGVGGDSFTISYESDGNNVHAATNAGNYTAAVNDVGNSNYTVVDGVNISKEWKISYPDIDAGVTVSGDKQKPSSRWYIGDVTIKPDTGYQIQKEGDSQWQDELVITDEGRTSVTYQLKDSNGYITAPETKEICIDRIAPTGEISVGSDNSNKWNTFLNVITFGRFFKETQSVKISGVDEVGGSGVNQVYYYVSETALTQEQVYALEDSDWKAIPNNGTFSIDPDKKLILYAKISDEAGYTIWISSDGLVLDATAPAITGVTDGKKYCGEKTITIKDVNLDTITVNGIGVTLMDDSYPLSTPEASGEDFMIVATDKAGNSTTVNVTIYKDHNWPNDWTVTKQETATEDGKEEQLCSNCGQKKYRTIPAIGSQEADPTNGRLTKDTEVAPDAPVTTATLNNAKSEIFNASGIFSQAEKDKVTDEGKDARIWLEISKTDENQITPTDQANIMNAAEQIMGENPDITYFDADLFKKIGNDSKIKISEPGIYIEVTIQIPDDLLNHDRVMIREYQIIRLHGGAVTVIRNGIFNENTKEFTFKTDKFSTYAIAYSDTPRPGSTSGGDGGSGGSTIISVPVTNITVTPEKATLTKKGETLSLTAKVVPTNATNQKVTWASSDSKVATVDENGIVTAVGDGTVTITATTANGKSASSMITVKITPEEPDVGDIQMDTTYRKLRLRVPTSTKTTNVLKWTKFSGADGYVIYGNKCNTKSKTYKMVQQVVIKDGSTTTWVDKKLASGTYYKYYIKAYKLVNGKKVWLAKSKVVHSTTTGGKYGNAKSVKVNKTAVSLAAGKTFTIKAKQIVKDLPIKKHTEIKYESSNSKVASANSKGVIKAKSKGTCYIYVYAQNGMYKRIKVTVK